jgi:hypothetical protein
MKKKLTALVLAAVATVGLGTVVAQMTAPTPAPAATGWPCPGC